VAESELVGCGGWVERLVEPVDVDASDTGADQQTLQNRVVTLCETPGSR